MSGLELRLGDHEFQLRGRDRVLIGRSTAATVEARSPLVSREHLELVYDGRHWMAQDLGTANGTFIDGRPIASRTPVELRPGLVLMLGDPQHGERLEVLGPVDSQPSPARHPASAPREAVGDVQPATVITDRTITIGRAADNSLIIPDPMVSAHHARVTWVAPGRYRVEDLRSTNGTYVNGARVITAEVEVGAIVGVERLQLRVTAAGLERVDSVGRRPGASVDPARPALSVARVTFSVESGGHGQRKRLLDEVTFSVPERSLLAVIGPSGAGKSTMLKTMIGQLRPDSGQVLFDGLDMSIFAESLAHRVGVVPQDDLVHAELDARTALEYAAKLRFPDEATASERTEAVNWALRELGLEAHADTRISRLSGGQRKRVSTAMELLTKPDLLFLDEPTSGLDPNLDREVMELLRELAHGTAQNPGGRVVVVITHATDNLDKADYVLLLAPGGKVAYFGPPAQLQPYFSGQLHGDTAFSSIYALITREPVAAQTSFARSGLRPSAVTQVTQMASNLPPASAPRKRLLRQTLILLSRQARLMIADRSLVLFTVALPIVMGLLTVAIQAKDGFNAASTSKAVGDPKVLLVIVVFGSVLMGMVPAVRQLVGERSIFVHEAAVGVRPSAYLASKILLLGVVCAIQAALLIITTLRLNPAPSDGAVGSLPVELFLISFGAAWTSAALGLLLSGIVKTSDQVMPLMIVVLMLQLVMSGGVISVLAPAINAVSMLTPARWAYAGGASSLDFNRAILCNAEELIKAKEDEEVNRKTREAAEEADQKAADQAAEQGLPAPDPTEPKVQQTVVDCNSVDDQDGLWDHSAASWVADLTVLGDFMVLYLALTFLVVNRRLRKT